MMKRISNKAALLIMLAMGLVAVAATALVGIYLGRRDAQRTMDRTVYYLERQCVTYREIIVADEVKSLVRLTEQAAERATSGVRLRSSFAPFFKRGTPERKLPPRSVSIWGFPSEPMEIPQS